MLGNRKFGVLTASKSLLDDDFLEVSGVTKAMNVVVQGIEEATEFYATHMGGKRIEMDVNLPRDQVVGIATRIAEAHPDMAGMLIACSTLPTFCTDIQRVTGLPVLMEPLMNDEPEQWRNFALFFLLVADLAALSYRIVETPLRRRIRRWGGKDPTPPSRLAVPG